MEITNQPIGGSRPSRNAKSDAIDITLPNREGIQRVKDDFEAVAYRHVDEIELSDEARKLAQKSVESEANDEAQRQARVDELRQQYLEGNLNTPKRIERAAGRLLLGE